MSSTESTDQQPISIDQRPKSEPFRVDQYGTVFELFTDGNAYYAIGKLNGKSLAGFLEDYRDQQENDND
jgi:hypothetical protein